MKLLFTLLFTLSSYNTFSNTVTEELIAQKGISCLKEQYSIFDSKNLQNISDKVNCNQKVSITTDNKLSNLDCPSSPIFESFLVSDHTNRIPSSCLRNSRNNSPDLYENTNCECVTESLKIDYKDKYNEKTKEFKEILNKKIRKNIGKRIKKKIEFIKNSNILLGNSNSCFNKKFFPAMVIKQTEFYNCSENSEQALNRIKDIFGESLGVEIKENDLDTSLKNLIESVKKTGNLGNTQQLAKNSCFQDTKQLEEKYIQMKYDDKLIDLKETFGDFIKGRNLNSPTLNQDFNNYINNKGIDLHPHIRSLSKDHLSSFLKEIDNNKNSKGLTLNQFLNGPNKRKWLHNLAIANRSQCPGIAQDIAKTICSDANMAYDDPHLINTFLKDDKEFQVKNSLNLKALYCEKKDIHTIDSKGKLLVYKSKLDLGDDSISDKNKAKDLENITRSLQNQKPEEALEHIHKSIERQMSYSPVAENMKNTQRLKLLDELKNFVFISNADKIFKGKQDGSKNSTQNRKSIMTFISGIQKAKKNLLAKQENDITSVAKDMYKLSPTDLSENEFKKKVLNNFKDRKLSRFLTNSLSTFNDNDELNLKEGKCLNNFTNIYCSVSDSLDSKLSKSCVDSVGQFSTINFIKNSSKINQSHNFCQAQSLIDENTIPDLLASIKESVNNNPELCAQIASTGYINEYKSANNDRSISNASIENITGSPSGLLNGLRDSENFIEFDTSNNESTLENIQAQNFTDATDSNSGIQAPIKEDSSTNLFSGFNFFKDSQFSTMNKEQLSDVKIDDLKEEIENKSNSELLDYIKKLEEAIKSKEADVQSLSTEKEQSSTVSSELKKLQDELKDLQEKSELVKNQINDLGNDTAPKVQNTSPSSTVKSSNNIFSNKLNKSTSTAPDEDLNKDQNESFSNETAQSPSFDNSVQNSLGNSISLGANEQIDSIVNIPNSEGEVEFLFNNEKVTLEVKENDNGEMICKFADEDLNKKNENDLDEICKSYLESLKKIKDKTKKKEKKKKSPLPKKIETKKKRQKFKVEDLNKVLNN